MSNKIKRSMGLRAFNALCATVFFTSVIYIMLMGFQAAAIATVGFAIAGAATPVVLNGEGALEIVVGTFDAMIDGVVATVEAIASAIAGLFG